MNKMPYITMYHSVAEGADLAHDPFRITVSPGRFERQLAWLARFGLRGVSVRELLSAHTRRGLVGLTFDDGYADFLDAAVPALRRRGFTATVFVVAGRLDTVNAWERGGPVKPLMSADAVLACIDAGMEVGSHGLRHEHLSHLDAREATAEINRSWELLSDMLHAPIAGYCYAYGDHDGRAVRLVRDCGYEYACAVRPSAWSGRYALPRTYIGEADNVVRLAVKRARAALSPAGPR